MEIHTNQKTLFHLKENYLMYTLLVIEVHFLVEIKNNQKHLNFKKISEFQFLNQNFPKIKKYSMNNLYWQK